MSAVGRPKDRSASGGPRRVGWSIGALVVPVLLLLAATPALAASLPGAPRSPTAQGGNGTVKLTWGAAPANWSPLTAYVVTPVADGIVGAPVSFGPAATTQTITGLVNGTTYAFRIAAVNAVGTGPVAETAPVTVGLPSAPALPGVTSGNGSAKVTWWGANGNGSPITGYVVTPVQGTTVLAARTFGTPATNQTITGLTNGASYTFRVAAVNAVGTGPATTTPAVVVGLPGAPGSPSAKGANASATVKWSAATANGSPITGYVVTPVDGTTALAPQAFSSPATTQTVVGLTNARSYTFRVAAVNAAGVGAPSTTPAAVIGLPGGTAFPTAVGGATSAKLSWWAAAPNGSPITSYTVTPVASGVAGTPLTFGPAATSQTITGLTPGTTYTFRVAATNAAGRGPEMTSGAVLVGLPYAPSGASAVGGNASAVVKWTAPAAESLPITGYSITPVQGSTVLEPQVFTSTATTQTVTGLTNGASYAFRIAALNTTGTGPMVTTAAVTIGLPGGTAFPTATSLDGAAKVSWWSAAANGSPILGYTVTPVQGGSVLASRSFDGTATTQTISGLTNGVAYTFRIAARSAVGSGPTATTAAVVVGVPPAPGKPTASVASGIGRVNLSWAPPTGSWPSLTGYVVTPLRAGAPQPPITFPGTATSRTIVGLTAPGPYTFTVTATTAVATSPASAASNAVTPPVPTVPAAPTAVAAKAGNGFATVTWTTPPDGGAAIVGYVITPVAAGIALDPVFVDPSVTTRIVDGLANGVAHTFTVAAVNAIGTGPASAASSPVAPAVPPAPTERGSIDLVGDSIAFQSFWSRDGEFAAQGQPPGTDVVKDAGLGLKFEDLLAPEERRIHDIGRPSVLVIALGTNNANPTATGGWDGADEVAFRQLLEAPSPSSCVVVVLPGYGSQAPADRKVQDELARAAMVAMGSQRERTVFADWGAVARAHPELLADDGVHLASDAVLPGQAANPASADAFAATIWQGVQQCPADALEPDTDRFTGLSNPAGIAVAEDGTRYVADASNDRVVQRTAAGVQSTVPLTGLAGPGAVAVDDEGNLFVADTNNSRVVELTTDGTQITLPIDGLDHPVGLAIEPDGSLLVADTLHDRIVRWRAGGEAGPVPFTDLFRPIGVASAPDGSVVVADTFHDRLVRLAPDGAQTVIDTGVLKTPLGVAVDGAGTVYAADTVDAHLVAVPVDGPARPSTIAGLGRVTGLAIGPDGTLYVVDSTNNRVLELDP